METFVSDLLENADLWEITKKDVRNKYKKFLGRDISAEEKAKINDLVYAFVYYYAAKQKTSEEASQKPTKSACIMSDKENKQKHVKEKLTKSSNLSSVKRSQALTGQVADRNNIKQFTKLKRPSDKKYKEHGETDNRTPRKVYPIRKRKLSTKLQLAEAVSAIMKSESESSSDQSETESSDLESEEEKDEVQKKQIESALRNLNNAREIRIKMAKARKQTDVPAAITGNSNQQTQKWTEEHKKSENGMRSSPVVDSCSSDCIILLSETDSLSDAKEYRNDSSMNDVKPKRLIEAGDVKEGKNMGDTKKGGIMNLSDTKKGGPVIGDKTETEGRVKKNGVTVSGDSTRKEGIVKMKGDIEGVGNIRTGGLSNRKEIMLKDRTKLGTGQTVKKKIKILKDGNKTNSTQSGDSGKLNVKKTVGSYSKAKKLWHRVVGKGFSMKKKKLEQKIVIETDPESETENLIRKKSKISALKQEVDKKELTDRKKIINLVRKKREAAAMKKMNKEREEKHISSEVDTNFTNRKTIMNLVRKKREDAAMKKLDKVRKEIFNSREIEQTGETETENESNTEACDYSEQNSDTSSPMKSKDNSSDQINDRTLVICDMNGSCDGMIEVSSDEEKGSDTATSCDSPRTQSNETDSPLKTTPSQLSKKKRRKMELASDDDSSRNGIYILSDESSDEDEPLSCIRAKITEKKMRQTIQKPAKHQTNIHESRHLLQLKKICRACGIFPRVDRELKGCFTNEDKIMTLKKVLKDAGMQGQPSLKKAEELKLKKEAAELNVENILTTETGRGLRNVKSIYARPKIQSSTNTTPDRNKTGMFPDDADLLSAKSFSLELKDD